MTQIEPIYDLPPFDWSDLAQLEMQENGLDLIRQTDRMWRIGNVAVCGFIWHSFYQPPWMWFALGKGVTLRELLDFRRLAGQIPEGTTTGVRVDQTEALRFAELYGFHYTGSDVGDYRIYRKES